MAGPEAMKVFPRYLKDTLRFKWYLIEALVWMHVVTGIRLVLPQFIRKMLDDFIPARDFPKALWYSAAILVAFIIRSLLSVRRNSRMLRFGYGFVLHMRTRLMRHFQLLSSRYYDKTPLGDIITRMLDDIMNVEFMTTNALMHIVTSLLMVSGVAGMLFWMDARLALAALTIAPLYYLNFRFFRDRLRQRYARIQKNYSELSTEFTESIAGMKIIKSYSLEREKQARLHHFMGQDFWIRLKTYTMNAIFGSISEFLTVVGAVVVLLLGSYLVMEGRITVGEVVAFYAYIGFLYAPLQQLAHVTQLIHKGIVSLGRVYEVLDTKPWPPEKPHAIDPGRAEGRIRFEDVTFYYDQSKLPSLKNVNFTVEPRQTVALVGASGSGKSTIINLLLRFYDPTHGQVSLDGRNVRDLQINPLRQNMAIVLQEPFLFTGSIYENIRMGRLEARPEEIEDAAKKANAWGLIAAQREGIHAKIGDGGVHLSGGEKQLIAAARAILRDAPIVLLDEATSAMDNEMQSLVQSSLEHLCRDRSTIVIAHRLNTVQRADRIYVMKEGEIVESGKHEELLAAKGYYARLYELQFFAGENEVC